MKIINITISDNLSPQEEIVAIAKLLGRKMLPSNRKLIGDNYELQQLNTQINITRMPVDKPAVTMVCSACETVFEKSIGKSVWINYGGKTRQKTYCSDGCRQLLLDIAGPGRAAINKSGLVFKHYQRRTIQAG